MDKSQIIARFGPPPDAIPMPVVLGVHWVGCIAVLSIVRPPFALDDRAHLHRARMVVIASVATAAALALRECGMSPSDAMCGAVEALHRLQ